MKTGSLMSGTTRGKIARFKTCFDSKSGKHYTHVGPDQFGTQQLQYWTCANWLLFLVPVSQYVGCAEILR